MHSSRSAMRSGFTLIELMIVVTIISILAVVGMGSYKRYGSRARGAEVYAMLGEIRAKEEAYKAEFSVYCTQSTTNCTSTPGAETAFYPALYTDGTEPRAKAISSTTWPVTWTTMGLNPGKPSLYCGYLINAGTGTAAASPQWSSAGARGAAVITGGGTVPAPTGPWWYAIGTCDMDSTAGPNNSMFTTAMNTNTVVLANEGQ